MKFPLFSPPLKCHRLSWLEGGFLAALEKDAKERAQQRRRNEQLANGDCWETSEMSGTEGVALAQAQGFLGAAAPWVPAGSPAAAAALGWREGIWAGQRGTLSFPSGGGMAAVK